MMFEPDLSLSFVPTTALSVSGGAERAMPQRIWRYAQKEALEDTSYPLIFKDYLPFFGGQERPLDEQFLSNAFGLWYGVQQAVLAKTQSKYACYATNIKNDIFGHQLSAAITADRIACRMGLDTVSRETLSLASLLHDIGKVKLDLDVLFATRHLKESEREIIQKHPQLSSQMILEFACDEKIRHVFPDTDWQKVAFIASQHHERLDGAGYPHKIAGDQVSLQASILAVADTHAAMTQIRCYQPNPHTQTETIAAILKNPEKNYPYDVVAAYCSALLYPSKEPRPLRSAITRPLPTGVFHLNS